MSDSHFDAIATVYDESLPAHVVEHYLRKRVAFLSAVCPVGRALDVGCGTGLCLPLLRHKVGRTGGIVGIDESEQMLQVADLIEPYGEFRITREQNFILTDIPAADVDKVIAAVERIGFPWNVNKVRGTSIGCTGDPHCNFAVGPTKPKLIDIVKSNKVITKVALADDSVAVTYTGQ